MKASIESPRHSSEAPISRAESLEKRWTRLAFILPNPVFSCRVFVESPTGADRYEVCDPKPETMQGG